MAYLEELLPEFRKGAKIRLIGSRDDEYYYIKHNVIYNQNGTPIKDFSLSMVMADIWELYQEPIDWDYIIKNKCLCWFWDHSEERKIAGLLVRLISQDEYRFEQGAYNGEPSIPYMICSPVRRDEITFYEERKDE